MFRLDKPIAIRMTNNDADRLQELADENFCSMSTYCRVILKTHLDDTEE